MPTKAILSHLKKHGEQLDVDIAKAISLSVDKTRIHLARLADERKVIVYHSTRFIEGKRIDGVRCRLMW